MENELAQFIGTAARHARLALELTQEDAAERVGVSVEFYARIERGNALPSVQTLAGISKSLGVSGDVLIGRAPLPSADAVSGAALPWQPAAPPVDPPELRRLVRRLRKASPNTLRIMSLLLKELENK